MEGEKEDFRGLSKKIPEVHNKVVLLMKILKKNIKCVSLYKKIRQKIKNGKE
jgi:hypothetical protein